MCYTPRWSTIMLALPLLVLLCLATGCGSVDGEGGDSAPDTGSITGTVLDAATFLPRAGAQVIATQNGEPVGTDTTDTNGEFTLNVPAGTTTLTASLEGRTSDPVTVDVVVDETQTGVVLMLPVPPQEVAFVLTTNTVVGSFSTITLDRRMVTPSIDSVGSDPQARFFHGLIYVINRFPQNTIQILDPQSNFATVRQFTTGVGSDPHDIMVLSAEKAYVTRYDLDTLLVVNPTTGQFLKEIDLSAFADADGIPEMDQMLIVEDRLYVSLQRLNRNNNFLPSDLSLLVIINTITDQVIDTIELTGTHPVTQLLFDQTNNRILVGEMGESFFFDGGIDAIDIATNQATGFVVSEVTLGGDISAFTLLSETKGYAVVRGNFTLLVAFNPRTDRLLNTLFTAASGFFLSALAINDRNELFVGDRTPFLPGIRIFDTATDQEVTAIPIDVGLPPAEAPRAILFF